MFSHRQHKFTRGTGTGTDNASRATALDTRWPGYNRGAQRLLQQIEANKIWNTYSKGI